LVFNWVRFRPGFFWSTTFGLWSLFHQLAEAEQRPQLVGTRAGKLGIARLIGVGFHRFSLVANV
jgi:hypothetical protein